MVEVYKDTRYVCPFCGARYMSIDDALDCCPNSVETVEVFICAECDEEYDTLEEARGCSCLEEED